MSSFHSRDGCKLPESEQKQNLVKYLRWEMEECEKRAKKCKPDVCFDVSVEEECCLAKAEVYRCILGMIL